MKKIILTALTVLMIFGLIGCSGVLHDKAALDISGFAVVGPNGSWDGSQKLTKVSDNEFTFEFVANGETEQVSLQLVPGSWDTRYCGDLGGGKQAEVEADNKESSATMVYYEGGDPKHMLMKGLKAGGKYKITFKVNEANDIVVSVVSAGTVVLPEPFLLDGLVVTTDALGAKPTLDGILLSPKVEDTLVGDATYKVRFKATSTEHTFAITDVEGKVKYTSDKAIEFKKSVDLKAAGEKDKATTITGLTAEGKYEITITTTPAGKVSVVVEEAPIKVTGAKITVSELPSDLNGKTLYFTGDFNGWKGPGDKESIEAKVTDEGVISITLPDFEYKIADGGKSFSGKFANTGWTKPEICAAEGNINFTLTETKKTLKGTYKSVSDEVYVCDWVVE